jgi:hypothetical protein
MVINTQESFDAWLKTRYHRANEEAWEPAGDLFRDYKKWAVNSYEGLEEPFVSEPVWREMMGNSGFKTVHAKGRMRWAGFELYYVGIRRIEL